MNSSSLLLRLKELGIKVQAKDGNLEVEDPKNKLDDLLLQKIKDSKQQLLQRLNSSESGSIFKKVRVIEEQDYYNVTPGQRRFWIIEHLQNEDGINNISDAYRIQDLDLKLFKSSVKILMQRHESLRTRFVEIDGQPMQKISDACFSNVFTELKVDIGSNENDAAIIDLINNELKKPFDLKNGPLLRINIIQLGNNEFVIQLTMHHIICDGHSLNLLKNEIAEIYSKLSINTSVNSHPNSIQYKDFAAWQNVQMSDVKFNQHKKYWQNSFEFPAHPIDLPFANTRPAIKTYNGAYKKFEFDGDLSNAILSFNQDQGQTVYMKLLAGVYMLLYRYTLQSDITLGTSVSGREKLEFENQIGLFLNTLPLRINIASDTTFKQLLDGVKKVVLNGFAHQSYSFDKLVEALDIKRDLSRMPLFDIMVELESVENYRIHDDLDIPVMEGFKSITLDHVSSRFDLVFNFYHWDNKLGLGITYNTDLFDKFWVDNLSIHLKSILTEAINNPNQPLGQLDYISSNETGEILRLFNKTTIEFPADPKIHNLFEKIVKRSPDNLAISFKEKSLTYSEVDKISNFLATKLSNDFDVKPGEIVALGLERSELLPIVILGVLKSGAAFLPLDVATPIARANHILDETGVDVVITNSGDKSEWISNFKGRTFDLLSDLEDEIPAKLMPSYAGLEDDLAYIMYTSGSTGVPKGVKINHASVINFLKSMQIEPGIKAQDKLLAITTYIFDISILELLLPLTVGASITIASEEETLDPTKIKNILSKDEISIMQATPTFWKALLMVGWDGNKSLKMLSGGEPLSFNLARSLVAKGASLWNMYGPTETTIWSSVKRVDPDFQVITIGKPIANTQFFILDKHGNLVPKGVNGEICISGKGLSAGYFNNREETNDKFVQHPFIQRELLYKTGDIGRWMANGELLCEGRKDNQVKVRGHRIELEEIESNLLNHRGIEDVVVAVKEKDGEQFICSYYLGADTISSTDLRMFLKNNLPSYMIPSHFFHMRKFPLTSNGKLNRVALPLPASKVEENYIPPSNVLEAELIGIWSNVLSLSLSDIGVNSDFFELGGHSILAIKLINQLQKFAGVSISLPVFFKDPTISAVAEIINKGKLNEELLPEITADEENRFAPFPLTDIQQAYWIGRKDLFDFGNVGTHVYVEAHVNELDIDRFHRSFRQLIERHEMLRVIIDSNGQQRILEEVPKFEAKILDLRKMEDQVATAAFYEFRNELSHKVYTGEQWPLFDIGITIFNDNTFKVHYSMDALVMDAASSDIFLQEFLMLYTNQVDEFDPIPISFRDYVNAEVALRLTGIYDKSKTYWLTRIPNMPLAPDLPTNRTQGNSTKTSFERQSGHLDIASWNKLQQMAKNLSITPTVFLTGCFAQILKKWSKTAHFTLNLTLFNRVPYHQAVDRLIGDFTSLTLLEIDARETKPFETQLKDIQLRLWEDLEHKHFSGIEVQRELSRQHGHTVTMPVVVTSTLGLGNEVEAEEEDETIINQPIQEHYAITQTPQVWLDFQFEDDNDGLWYNWDSIEGFFPEDMIQQMFASFKLLLESLVKNERLWKSSNLIPMPDHQLEYRKKVNLTHETPSTKLLHELFYDQALQYPDKTALIYGEQKITYSQLNQASHLLAQELKSRAVAKNQLVAVVMEKGWEQIVSCMGILYSGAAYLPISGDLPEDRIQMLIQQGEAQIVITSSAVKAKVNFPKDVGVIVIGEDHLNQSTVVEFEIVQNLNDLAYVIFTSGSTGIPKGVMIDHQGAVNTILDINDKFNVTSEDSVLAISSLSFDLSVYDIFGLLSVGGTIVIPNQSELRSPDAWMDYINKYDVTLWNTVPALMQMMVDFTTHPKPFTSLRLVLLSGDWIPVSLPSQIKALNESIKIISLGGATEASIWSIYYPIDAVDPSWISIPYGKPLKNQQFYVLQPDLSPCPDYVIGDLYIAGIGLAKGYWKDPEKTNSSFITHPHTKQRLYRTGDLGRFLPDGNIEFLGREDNQVKIQGYRIELGEIEEAIKGFEFVKDAAVTTSDSGEFSKQIIAYVTHNNLNDNVQDSVGFLKDAEATLINDPNQRVVFKLSETGIRNIITSAESIDLIADESLGQLQVEERENIKFSFVDQALELKVFSKMLSCLQQHKNDELVLPKYFYPSAGSLYPVQAYLHIGERCVLGINEGYYYYNPKLNRLELLNVSDDLDSSSNHKTISLYLIADFDAISPLYGKMAPSFCAQEAGYISHLLLNSKVENVAWMIDQESFDVPFLTEKFKLGDNHQPLLKFNGGKAKEVKRDPGLENPLRRDSDAQLAKNVIKLPKPVRLPTIDFSYLARKSYRTYSLEKVSFLDLSQLLGAFNLGNHTFFSNQSLSVYILVKSERIENIPEGIYSYHPPTNQLHYITMIGDAPSIFASNDWIFERSGFAIFLVGKPSVENDYLGGYLGQNMMVRATQNLLGLCAVGGVLEEQLFDVLKLEKERKIINTWIAGKISPDQLESIEQFKQENGVERMEKELKVHLSNQLPEYMIPSYFVPIEKIPLSTNGKLDKKALPTVEFKIDTQFEKAETPMENLMVSIWSEVLELDRDKIGINANFFELGGDSMKVIKLHKQLKEKVSFPIKVQTLFDHQSIKAFIEATQFHLEQSDEVEEVRLFDF